MVVVKYPICGCEYQTGDLSGDVADKQDKLGNLMFAGDPWLMAKSKSYVAKLMALIVIIKVAIGLKRAEFMNQHQEHDEPVNCRHIQIDHNRWSKVLIFITLFVISNIKFLFKVLIVDFYRS